MNVPAGPAVMVETGDLSYGNYPAEVNYDLFFEGYVDAYNRALEGHLDTALIRGFFTDRFLAAGPDEVNTGKNNFLFSLALRKAYAFYRKIGTRRMKVLHTVDTPIDEKHDMVKVFYRADYVRPRNNQPLSIDFCIVYFLVKTSLQPKIFAFVSDDEMQAYRDAGLV